MPLRIRSRDSTPDPGGIAAFLDPGGIAGILDPAGIAAILDPAGIVAILDPGGIAGILDPAGIVAILDPGGISEISRWREPPEPGQQIDPAPEGRRMREVGRWRGGAFRCPCRGPGSSHAGTRWLAPPADFTCPCRGSSGSLGSVAD